MDRLLSFAITARTLGHPRSLYTPLLVMNLDALMAAEVNAMWDTGAAICVMSRALAEALHLNFLVRTETRGLTGSAEAAIGYTYVSLVNGGGIITVECAVVDNPIGKNEYSFIIGMNLIRKGTLAISGYESGITLSFKIPSSDIIDFVSSSPDSTPTAVVPLSFGVEHLRVYSGREALDVIRCAVPDVLK